MGHCVASTNSQEGLERQEETREAGRDQTSNSAPSFNWLMPYGGSKQYDFPIQKYKEREPQKPS